MTQPNTPKPNPASTDATKRMGRRRVLQAGLIGVPLILTLRGRPAQAQALGTLGIFYGRYTNKDAKGNIIKDSAGKEIWVPADADGKPLKQPDGGYNMDRRDSTPGQTF